ncbi:MAG: DUF4013 domain-containing protein [Aureliella sp.]
MNRSEDSTPLRPLDQNLAQPTEPPRIMPDRRQPPVVEQASTPNRLAELPTQPDLEPPVAVTPEARSPTVEPPIAEPVREGGPALELEATAANSVDGEPESSSTSRPKTWLNFPLRVIVGSWEVLGVYILLASVAAIPVVQFVSLGYLLHSAGLLAKGQPWRSCLPGARIAGRITLFVLCAVLCWLPVWLTTSLSYSAQLLQPESQSAFLWRVGAFTITFAWLVHVAWAATRGGRWWHFIWPAPIRFLKEGLRPSAWKRASDELFELVDSLHLPRLWWLGLRAAVGAILWTCVPVSMMIIGLRAQGDGPFGLVGLLGAIAMGVIMLYLPFLQLQLARSGRFKEVFNVIEVRRRFTAAPLAHAFALLLLCALSIPLYLLRIEATPSELLWAPALVFVLLMMPAKWILGAAMGYADSRRLAAGGLPYPEEWTSKPQKKAHLRLGRRSWLLRWPARTIALASVVIYVGALYFAQLAAGQGAWGMYFQHAVLVPAPLISS